MTYDEAVAHLKGLTAEQLTVYVMGPHPEQPPDAAVRIAGTLERIASDHDNTYLYMNGGDVVLNLAKNEVTAMQLTKSEGGMMLTVTLGGTVSVAFLHLPPQWAG